MSRITSPFKTSRRILSASIVSFLAISSSVQAANLNKANNTDNLNTGTSWIGGVMPGAADTALWDSTVTGTNAVSLGADLNWKGIIITNPGGAVTINGSNTLTLGSSGIDMSSATQDLAIGLGLTIGRGSQVWNLASGRTLTLNTGTFTRTAGATLNIQGLGTVTSSMTGLANDASEGGGILGPWLTLGTEASTTYAQLSGGKIVAYTGGTSGVANAIASSSTSATNYTIATAANGTYGITRTLNTLRNTAGASTLTIGNSASQTTMTLNGILNAGTGTLTINPGGSHANNGVMIGAGNGRELVLNAANASISLGRIVDNAGGASSVTVTSAGSNTVTLTGGNT
ncbi:MAG: hypothetical protein EOP84_27640, partial [Verrucomicrobiaceae bacterium]